MKKAKMLSLMAGLVLAMFHALYAQETRYNFAAIIYDTDRSVNCSFNPNNNTAGWNATGFKKGIVQPTLDANRKLQFNVSAATERCSRSNESNSTACVYSSATAAPSNCIADLRH